MGTTCNEGPLHTTILRQIYLYWQWPFGTPEKLLVRGFMLSLVPCDLPGHGGLNLCWFSSWLSYKSGRREYSFFLLCWSYTPNWTTVYPVMQVLMGGGKLMSSRFGFLLFMMCFFGDSATCMYYPSGLKHRLDPRALSWCNIRQCSSLCLPSPRCKPCVLE